MRRSVLVVVLVTLTIAVNAGRTKLKSFEAVKHGVARGPHHGRLRDHKPVDESPHSVYKDEWLKMTKYTKTKSSDCKEKCGKHQICLVDSTTGATECFSRHNFREGRRLFRKFRNHDTKGLRKTIEDYSQHHQKHGDKHQKHKNQHNYNNKLGHINQHQDVLEQELSAPPMPNQTEPHHNKQHPHHNKQHPHHNKQHPHHKKHMEKHHKDHPKHPHNKDHPKHPHNNDHPKHPHNKDHPKHAEHLQHKKGHSQHNDHKKQHHQKTEITNNHSGPQKTVEKIEELHAELTPNTVHGHVVGANEQEVQKVLDARVSLREGNVQKAVINKLVGKVHHKPGHSKPAHHKHAPQHNGPKHHEKHHRRPKFPKHHVCKKAELDVMSSRLTGWFALLHARNEEKLHLKLPIHKHIHKCDCQETAVWAFHQFDHDADLHLNHSELRHLEANQNEPCLTPFIESCDHNLDALLSRKEWCCCFAKTQPPCLERKQSLQDHNLLGAFSPRCDEAGYYEKEQCHSGTGYCWCVDLNGNEIPKTRALKRANCEKLSVMGYEMKN